MTEKLYHQDAYLQEFEAIVTQLSEDRVALDRTAFYPGGGGQPSDLGRMVRGADEFMVCKVKTEAGEIWHTVDPERIQQVRVVEIDGLDLQADGGTHVGNTSEVGRIRVVDYKSKGRINKRLVVELED